MDLSIQPMTIDEYAETQKALGGKIVRTGAVYWRRIRPFFYRPLLPCKAYDENGIVTPSRYFGGFQHVVAGREKANSTMNFLMLDQCHEYDLGSLNHERRRRIKKASRLFEARPLEDAKEFREKGYHAYMSFYRRTAYSYKKDRIQREEFDKWVDTVIRFPGVILWGGYGKGGLVAVSIAYWVEEVLLYATFFCETESLRKGLGELMFHKLRETAAQEPGVREILVRPYQGGNNLDKYYMLRGCRVLRRPANLQISPLAHLVLRSCLPRQYAMLYGRDRPACPAWKRDG